MRIDDSRFWFEVEAAHRSGTPVPLTEVWHDPPETIHHGLMRLVRLSKKEPDSGQSGTVMAATFRRDDGHEVTVRGFLTFLPSPPRP